MTSRKDIIKYESVQTKTRAALVFAFKSGKQIGLSDNASKTIAVLLLVRHQSASSQGYTELKEVLKRSSRKKQKLWISKYKITSERMENDIRQAYRNKAWKKYTKTFPKCYDRWIKRIK